MQQELKKMTQQHKNYAKTQKTKKREIKIM